MVRRLAEQTILEPQSLRVLTIMLRVAETKLNPASGDFEDAPLLRNYVATTLQILNETIIGHAFLRDLATFNATR